MSAHILEHPAAWPEEMNGAIETIQNPMSADASLLTEAYLRTAIEDYLDVHEVDELTRLVSEFI